VPSPPMVRSDAQWFVLSSVRVRPAETQPSLRKRRQATAVRDP